MNIRFIVLFFILVFIIPACNTQPESKKIDNGVNDKLKRNEEKFKVTKYADGFYWDGEKTIGVIDIKNNNNIITYLPTNMGIKTSIVFDAIDKPWYEYDFIFTTTPDGVTYKGWCKIHIKEQWIISIKEGHYFVIPISDTIRKQLTN